MQCSTDAARIALARDGYCLLPVVEPDGTAASTPSRVAALCEQVWGEAYGVERSYAGGTSSRDRVADGVFTVNKEPPDVSVTQHSEKTYQDSFPAFIAFYARHAATDGGETVLADNERVTAALPAPMRTKLQQVGVQYLRRLTDATRPLSDGEEVYQTWQKSFETDDAQVVQEVALAAGDNAVFDPKTGDLTLESRRAAFAQVPKDLRRPLDDVSSDDGAEEHDEELIMNQLFTYHASHQERGPRHSNMYAPWLHLPYHERPYHSRWGDGTELSQDEFDALSGCYDKYSVAIPVRTGEVLIVNNFRWTHGRRAYSGHRDILVVMSKSVTRCTRHPVELPVDSRLAGA